MARLIIEGGHRLEGRLRVQGAKNAALPLLAAALLIDGACVIHNCPRLTDVDAAMRILRQLGCRAVRQEGSVTVDASSMSCDVIPDDLMRQMRSSSVFMGPLLARCGTARLSLPGGCELGPRPLDLHLDALRRLGAVIEETNGTLDCRAPDGLRGTDLTLAYPSVGATENILLAACTARGVTRLYGAAREPEIVDLAGFLNACGGRIRGAGENTVVIEGVSRLHPCEWRAIPDRIAAATYLAAAAVTGGRVTLYDLVPAHLAPVLPVLERAGCALFCGADTLTLTAPPRLHGFGRVVTGPYPGFPTDAQPPIMAMALTADADSVFEETVFENRFRHAAALRLMGGRVEVTGRRATVRPAHGLTAAAVTAEDLRGGAALTVAALAADGVTLLDGVRHIDRGYEPVERALTALGAVITRRD